VRHRRQTHRFPVRIEAAYGADAESQLRPATVHDLNPFGLAMRVREPIPDNQQLRVVLLLDTGPLEVVGAVARAEQAAADSFHVGVRFDDLPQNKQDTIMRWCFAQPFGPDSPVQGDESRRPEALEPVEAGAGQGTGSDRRPSTPSGRPRLTARGRSDRTPDTVTLSSQP
jgi:hypothetical protein